VKTFTTLLKREWLESRFTYFAATLGLVALVTVFGSLATFMATLSDGGVVVVIERMDDAGNTERHERISDKVATLANFSGWTNRELESRLGGLRNTIASAFHSTYFLVLIFVLLGCIFDQRRERSVLFWKSMPASDQLTLLSKLVMPVWIVPLLVVAGITLSWIFMLGLLSAITVASDLGSVARLWAHSGIAGGMLQELIGYAIQGLWSLPLYAWLILISASVSRLPLVWAIMIPVIPVIGELILFKSNVIGSFLLRHLEFAALPRLPDEDRHTMAVMTVSDQLSLLLSGDLWLGVGLGAALLAGALWFYRRNNEL
jgi:ABC-2 type transport system permease protein